MKSVVIGAGLAGLSAALHLARAGREVTLYEASDRAGGRAQQFEAGGYRFDMGPTLLVMTDVLRAALGETAFSELRLQRLEPGYEVRWSGGDRLELHSDIALMLAEAARYERGNARGFLAYLARVHDAFLRARANVLEVDHTYASFARMMLRRERPPTWVLGALRAFTQRYVRHPRLVQALTFQSLYLGTSPLRAPAMYALLPVEEMVGGVWFAPGGTGAVVAAFVSEVQRAGARIVYGAAVSALHRDGESLAVTCNGERVRFDEAVIAMDRQPSFALFNGDAPNTREPRYGHSAYVWYLGVERPLELGHHTVLLPDDPWRAYAQLDAGRIPDEPMAYVCNPAASDAAFAPPGARALLVLAPVPNRKALPRFDEDALRDRVLCALERICGPVRDAIVFERRRGPREFERELGLQYGAAFGPDHTLDQMGPFRPSIAHPHLRNVVFAGSGTRPGSGVPMVVMSGRLAAERLLR